MARLAVATAKNHLVLQRAQIAQAIIVPKSAFLARHEWLERETVGRLQKLVKRFIWGHAGDRTQRAWMKEQVTELPLHDGGVGVPRIHTELLTMSGKVVANWAAAADVKSMRLGDILLQQHVDTIAYITPLYIAPPPWLQLSQSLWTTGSAVIAAAHAHAPSAAIQHLMTALAPSIQATVASAKWRRERLEVAVSEHARPLLKRVRTAQREAFGWTAIEWIPMVDVTAAGALWATGTKQLRVHQWMYCNGEYRLGRLVQWQWSSAGHLAFHPMRRTYPMTNDHAAQFRHICAAVILTYPRLLERPAQEDRLVLYPNDGDAITE